MAIDAGADRRLVLRSLAAASETYQEACAAGFADKTLRLVFFFGLKPFQSNVSNKIEPVADTYVPYAENPEFSGGEGMSATTTSSNGSRSRTND